MAVRTNGVRERLGLRPRLKRVSELVAWALREPTYWRVSLLLFVVLAFTLTSGVPRSAGSFTEPPEVTLANVLDSVPSVGVSLAYPFLSALTSVLATLAIAMPREAGGFASFQALGYRRGEILVAQCISVLLFAVVPSFAALLVLPPFVEPNLALRGNIAPLYPPAYWAHMPRLFFAIIFLDLFAASFAIMIRRVPLAFGAMITFFFIGWYLEGPLGFLYGIFTPSRAFQVAYDLELPIPGVPVNPNDSFLIYLGAAAIAFLSSLAYASRRGELQ